MVTLYRTVKDWEKEVVLKLMTFKILVYSSVQYLASTIVSIATENVNWSFGRIMIFIFYYFAVREGASDAEQDRES